MASDVEAADDVVDDDVDLLFVVGRHLTTSFAATAQQRNLTRKYLNRREMIYAFRPEGEENIQNHRNKAERKKVE